MSDSLVRCDTCNHEGPADQTDVWHPYRHPISGMLTTSEDPSTPDVQEAPPFPFDPVLRQALVDKGILTPQDLRDAEDKIRMVSGMRLTNG